MKTAILWWSNSGDIAMDVKISFPSPELAFDYKLLFDLAPHMIWAIVIVIVIAMIGPKRLATAFLNARKISFGGLEIDLKGEISEAVQAKGVDVSSQLEGQVARRMQSSWALTTGARLLWIDEHPNNNTIETHLFKRLGLIIDLATSDAGRSQSAGGACVRRGPLELDSCGRRRRRQKIHSHGPCRSAKSAYYILRWKGS